MKVKNKAKIKEKSLKIIIINSQLFSDILRLVL